jgi:hypothetical protein
MAKLTLSADPEVIAQARRLAEQQGTSISALFSRFVRILSRRQVSKTPLGRVARRATGLIRIPAGKTERDVLEKALAEKHGLGP